MADTAPAVEIDDSRLDRFEHSNGSPTWAIAQPDGSTVRTCLAEGLDVSVLTDQHDQSALILYLRLGDWGLHCEFTADEARITAAGLMRAAQALGGGAIQ